MRRVTIKKSVKYVKGNKVTEISMIWFQLKEASFS